MQGETSDEILPSSERTCCWVDILHTLRSIYIGVQSVQCHILKEPAVRLGCISAVRENHPMRNEDDLLRR